ncbi:MAG: LPS biosynthesis protein WbpP, partial [Clostridiales bacterium]|nr:LPS biosynthesis protein WbpP [Clostridiales bacterium]
AFNIAYGGEICVIDLYYYLCNALGKKIEPIFGPERLGDIKHSHADISKARDLLGYNPEWSFEDGIRESIKWYKENL